MLEVNFSPFPQLQTERLLLRQMLAEDAPQIFALRSNPVSMQYLSKPLMQKEADALAFINLITENLNNNVGITWAVTLKEYPQQLIGTFGFWRIEKEHYRAEIGYMLLPEYFGKGYTTEAIFCGTNFAFSQMKLHSIEANIDPENKASEAVLLKTGFVKEAYFKENFYYNGEFLDSAIFSLVRQ